jgi:8-oxo-dGTP pyrophosphatase MutT (NUDIX family)
MRAHGPWVIEETVQKYTNQFLTLREDRVKTPDGAPGSYATVSLKPGVAVLPVTGLGEVHLTRQFRYAIGRESVEAASGGVDNDEDPLDSAKRELREELGIVADEWADLGLIDADTSIVRGPCRLFVARALRMTEKDEDSTESIERLTLPMEAAVEMVMDGGITHAPSCVLILKAARDLVSRM